MLVLYLATKIEAIMCLLPKSHKRNLIKSKKLAIEVDCHFFTLQG